MRRWVGCAALAAVLASREQERARQAYLGQLLWHIGAQQFALAGGHDWPVPDYFALFPPRRLTGGGSRVGVLRHVLRALEGGRNDGGAV